MDSTYFCVFIKNYTKVLPPPPANMATTLFFHDNTNLL